MQRERSNARVRRWPIKERSSTSYAFIFEVGTVFVHQKCNQIEWVRKRLGRTGVVLRKRAAIVELPTGRTLSAQRAAKMIFIIIGADGFDELFVFPNEFENCARSVRLAFSHVASERST